MVGDGDAGRGCLSGIIVEDFFSGSVAAASGCGNLQFQVFLYLLQHIPCDAVQMGDGSIFKHLYTCGGLGERAKHLLLGVLAINTFQGGSVCKGEVPQLCDAPRCGEGDFLQSLRGGKGIAVHPGHGDHCTILPGKRGRHRTLCQLRRPIGQRSGTVMDAVEHPLRIHIIVSRSKAAQRQSQGILLNVGQGKIVRTLKPDFPHSHLLQGSKAFLVNAVYIFPDYQGKVAHHAGIGIGQVCVLRIPHQSFKPGTPSKGILPNARNAFRNCHRLQSTAVLKHIVCNARHALWERH